MMADETATASASDGSRFSVGQVLEDGFETLFRIFPRALAMSAIIAVPLLTWLVLGGTRLLALFAPNGQFSLSAEHFDPVMAILVVIVGLTNLFVTAAVTDAAFQDLLGEEGDLLQSLRNAVIAAPSLLACGAIIFLLLIAWVLLSSIFGAVFGALSFGSGLGAVFGVTILLIMTTVRWWVFLPAIVIERVGPFAGFGRSTVLTAKRRWSVFAVLLLIYVPEFMLKLVLILLAPKTGLAFSGIVNVFLSGLFILLNAVLTTAIYAHLRAEKEGAGTDHLAKVFD
jgi:hypothetical protein